MKHELKVSKEKKDTSYSDGNKPCQRKIEKNLRKERDLDDENDICQMAGESGH